MPADRYEAEARALLASSTTGDTARERGEWDSYDAWRASPNDVCADIAAALRAAERRGAERMRERAADACDFVARVLARGEVTFPDREGIDTCAGVASRIRALPLEEPSE
jgi:hypothetical protein